MNNDDLVSVLIPKPLVTRFYEWMATQTATRQTSPKAVVPKSGAMEYPSVSPRRSDEWTPELVDRMVAESGPAMRSLLTVLAERAGEWVSTDDLAEVLEHKDGASRSSTVAGTLGAFGRRVSHRYNRQFGITLLPFDGKWDHERKCKMNRMPKEIAPSVLRALKRFNQD